MANIQEDINQISTARYGRDVRSSIVDALTLMNVETESAYDKAETSQESARAYAEECEGYASRLENFDGGSTNQVLTKNSDADFDYSWKDSQGGSGGTSAIDVTQAEYDAHATEYAQTDSFYQISDADDTLSADDVAYGDNSTVGAFLDKVPRIGESSEDVELVPRDADTLGGVSASAYALRSDMSNLKFKAYESVARGWTKGAYTISWSTIGLNYSNIKIYSVTGMLSNYSVPVSTIDSSGNSDATWGVNIRTTSNGITIVCAGSWDSLPIRLLIAYAEI